MNSRATQHALFPNNTYADDSGGDPAAIPDLTFDECAAFPLCSSTTSLARNTRLLAPDIATILKMHYLPPVMLSVLFT